MYTIKPFEELTYHDDFMFGVVMKDREICRESLECMLGFDIDHIEYAESQKTIEPLYTSHGIRLDVYVQDGNRVYDVEIQNIDEQDLGKRTRYYQSMIDMDSLLKGQDYSELKESIVIFLCRFDPFKKQIPCYTVKRLCEQDTSINVNDAATVQIFNCTSYNKMKNENLRSFLKFVQTNKAESDFTRRLDNMVETQKQIEELKQTYLSWSLHDRDVRHEGMKEGISIGEKRGEERAKLEAARNMLMEGDSTEKIARCTDLTLETVQKLAEQLKVPAAQ
ncbi:MAG: Rpn family recombination-promoting nuclease/putative transposase [Alphaproteobacteria bacterium]|nr:Rpn family recombination-promoting nuclease/putative transposase [Alphaproteobacteria bacterium]